MRAVIADRLLASPRRVAMTGTLAVAAVVFAASTGLAANSDRYGWEERLTAWTVDLPDGFAAVLRVVMQAGNRLAVAALALVFLIADRPRRAAVVLIGGWGAWLAAVFVKAVVGRPRPTADVLGFSPEEFVGGRGFPSSHTAVAIALSVVVVTAAGVPRALRALAVAAAVLTGAARIHLAIHWPLDVIGGASLGVFVAGIVVVALDPAPVPEAWPGVGRWPPPADRAAPGALAPNPAPAGPLRVATFNIRNGWALDGRHGWPLRRSATAAMLGRLDADLAGLQEVYAFQRRWLARRVPGRGWVGLGRTDGVGRGEQCPVTWRPERLDLLSWEVRWFSEHPEEPGSRFARARVPRIATIARFRDRSSGLSIGVVNAHLDSEIADHRRRSASLIADWLAEEEGSWIVLGDLNDEADSATVRTLEAAGYRGVDPAEGAGTSHAFTGRRDGRRIDHILIGVGLVADQADVPTVPSGRTLPSDHWPVVVDLESVAEEGLRHQEPSTGQGQTDG